MTQFYSRIDTEYNGDVYSIPFSYLKQSEISVYIDNVLFTDWQFLNESQIQLTKIPSDITSTSIISIRRSTNISEKIVEYTNYTMLSKDALNLSQDQLLNAIQEMYDNNITFQLDVDELIEENQTELEEIIAQNKAELEEAQEVFETEINTKIQEVSDAAEKINELEEAVEEAKDAADSAEAKAVEAAIQARAAQQQADLAEQAAQDVENILDEIEALNLADASLSNITEAGKKVIKENSGGSGGLEVCDIGMSLYIDETKGLRRWLNGQIVAINQNTQGFLTRLKKIVALYPSLLTTEENWQAEKEASDYGQVGKFVLNYDDVADKYHAVGYDRYIFEVSLYKTTDTINPYRTAFCIHKLKDNIEVGDIGYLFDTATGEENQNITFTVTQVEANAGTEYAFFQLRGTVSGYPDYDPPKSGIESALDGTDIAANNNNSPVLQILKGPTYTKSRSGEGKNFCIPETTIGAVCYEVPYPSSPNSFTAIPHLLTHFEFVDGGILGDSSYSIGIDNEEILTDYGLYSTQPVYHYTPSTKVLISMRLPAVVNVQGLLDLQNLGMTVKAGLPNIIGNIYSSTNIGGPFDSASGAFSTYDQVGTCYANGGAKTVFRGVKFDTSKYNPIYSASDTVQEEAIQYPYYIQIATGQETEVNITNEIELNNPFFFGMSNYFQFKPNSLSWLKSAGYDEPKAAHPDYYNWILENVNKGVKGFKGQEGYCFIATDSSGYYWWVSTESPVVGASVYGYDAGVNSMFFYGTVETLTSNGFTFTSIFEGSSYTVTRDSSKDTSILHPTAWITDNDFEINTSDETFRLPLKNGTEGMFGGGAVVGNGMSLGLTNGSQTAGLTSLTYHSGVTDRGTLIGVTTGYGLNIGQSVAGSAGFNGIVTAGITTDPEKSGLVVANAGVVPDGWALYYYVGATVQNANLIDAGRMQEQITNINAPSRGYLVQSYVNGTSGYRVYSDGWCEQWGKSNSTSGQETITLTKAYNSINFTVLATSYANSLYGTAQIINNKTIWIESRGHDFTVQPCLVRWLTMGYIS